MRLVGVGEGVKYLQKIVHTTYKHFKLRKGWYGYSIL